MGFSIDSVILWPKKHNFRYKKIEFVAGKINIITGASRSGKSAIIPIIDYCLASDKCSIPVDTIRDACEWFGVVFELENEKILLCRKEPGNQESTNEMFFMRGEDIQIPERIDANITREAVNNILNELLSMSFLDINPSNNGFLGRPSFRDLMAFLFQPQNIIANADVLFYKADTMEHRQKLINIFPYVLGAVTSQILAARQEIDRLKRERDRVMRDIDAVKKVSEQWKQEIHAWLSKAYELGLTKYSYTNGESFEYQLKQLRIISEENETDSTIMAKNVIDSSNDMVRLRQEEQNISGKLFAAQQRYMEMNQLTNSMAQYENSLQIQLNRLDISEWLRTLYSIDSVCPLCGNKHESAKAELDNLCDAIARLEKNSGDLRQTPAAFEREMQIVKKEIDELSGQLTALRKRITIESEQNSSATDKKYTLYSIARFLGRLETSILTYDSISVDGELEKHLGELNDRLGELNRLVNEREIETKILAALKHVQLEANKIVSSLDVERPNDPIEFLIKDLTIRIINISGRRDYLWEIGSASNWLAYHIAMILGFHKFFLEKGRIMVPNFVVFDQPSQVYFPQKLAGKKEKEEEGHNEHVLDDEDKVAVQKIFLALSNFIKDTNSKIQIIVMEHADEDVWGGIDNIHLVKRWRGEHEKLIPNEWL